MDINWRPFGGSDRPAPAPEKERLFWVVDERIGLARAFTGVVADNGDVSIQGCPGRATVTHWAELDSPGGALPIVGVIDVELQFPIYHNYEHETDYPCGSWRKTWIESGILGAVIEEEIQIARPFYMPERIDVSISIRRYRDLSEWATYHKGSMDGIDTGTHGWSNDPTGFEEARKTVESTLRLSRCKGTFKDIGPK